MPEHMTSERRLAAAEKQRQALELRKAGTSFEQIAVHLGYKSRSGAFDAVMNGLKKTLREPADEVRKLELDRLDKMLMGLWPAACKGQWLAVDRVLLIMERRARLLGLDAPAQVNIEMRIRQAAEAMGLNPDEAVKEAQRIIKSAGVR